MTNLRIDGFSEFNSNGIGHVSSRDQNSFDSALGSAYESNSQRHEIARANSENAAQEMTEASMNSIKGSVVQKKNEMIMKARGSAFKTAAELTEKISF